MSLRFLVSPTDFMRLMRLKFDKKTACEVFEVFQKLGLPPPETKDEFLSATEGAVVFLNTFGIVIRIEYKTTPFLSPILTGHRINDSAWILKPIASIDAGKAVIEICPGISEASNRVSIPRLVWRLIQQGLLFTDSGARNVGQLPIKLPQFPEGVPVVIDRLAVYSLFNALAPVRRILGRTLSFLPSRDYQPLARQVSESEETLYGPLRQAFDDAWPKGAGAVNAEKMNRFWGMCKQYLREGKLLAGWNDSRYHHRSYKTHHASITAAYYEERLKAADELKRSGVSAIPQSPHQPT